ncbi:RNA polymerase sigma-54 factor [Parachlamydia acanthamoebae UV-7]|uniref:RNA polymerase sigma-54 factor n=2 Tax=Parachlamydia acanthamoebae TaxID=83552 RepID=F8KXL7_PARAV|nr:RNA polymerase factor sigma-54 [Parachlamydia acanthamoebae]KIA76971.1 RNA polymerase sigma-54 factor [Parachlamydia acanthamoebae]CCB87375.1 RNA polymerase sigma-54 factor [Parachlamydia acanthamoebae UV-7]
MVYPLSLQQQAKMQQSLKQTQRMIMSPQMQQAIHLLQMPLMELVDRIETELEQNPILESIQDYPEEDQDLTRLEEDNSEADLDEEQTPEKELLFDEQDFEILKQIDEDFRDHFAESGNYYTKRTEEEEKQKNFQLNSIQAHVSLFEHLMTIAQETFANPKDIQIAESIIGNFDERGFLQTSLTEIAVLNDFSVKELQRVLKTIQTFDPFGVGASDLQESFLIQLRCQKKEDSLAYKIIEDCYEDLLHNRLPIIKKHLNCSIEDIQKAIDKDISKLDLHPGASFSGEIAQTIVPDAMIKEEDGKLDIVVTSDFLPPIRLNKRYMKMLEDESLSDATRDFIRQRVISAKWLLRNIHHRNTTIDRIAQFLAQQQHAFFQNPDGQLVPLTMKTVADNLGLHESTVARAVAGKYVETPRGLLPFRFFFTNAYMTDEGSDISAETVREAIKDIIDKEDKSKPLSDHKISDLLEIKGIHCARRTVSKYRAELNLGNTQQRRLFRKSC